MCVEDSRGKGGRVSATVVAGDSFWGSLRPLWRTGGSAKGGDRQRGKKAPSHLREKKETKRKLWNTPRQEILFPTLPPHTFAPLAAARSAAVPSTNGPASGAAAPHAKKSRSAAEAISISLKASLSPSRSVDRGARITLLPRPCWRSVRTNIHMCA